MTHEPSGQSTKFQTYNKGLKHALPKVKALGHPKVEVENVSRAPCSSSPLSRAVSPSANLLWAPGQSEGM